MGDTDNRHASGNPPAWARRFSGLQSYACAGLVTFPTAATALASHSPWRSQLNRRVQHLSTTEVCWVGNAALRNIRQIPQFLDRRFKDWSDDWIAESPTAVDVGSTPGSRGSAAMAQGPVMAGWLAGLPHAERCGQYLSDSQIRRLIQMSRRNQLLWSRRRPQNLAVRGLSAGPASFSFGTALVHHTEDSSTRFLGNSQSSDQGTSGSRVPARVVGVVWVSGSSGSSGSPGSSGSRIPPKESGKTWDAIASQTSVPSTAIRDNSITTRSLRPLRPHRPQSPVPTSSAAQTHHCASSC